MLTWRGNWGGDSFGPYAFEASYCCSGWSNQLRHWVHWSCFFPSLPFNPKFRGISGGEDLVSLPGDVVKNMSTDQKACYKLVQAVKAGKLPPELQDMKCGRICHARWLTTAECIIFMWTREHGLTLFRHHGEALHRGCPLPHPHHSENLEDSTQVCQRCHHLLCEKGSLVCPP